MTENSAKPLKLVGILLILVLFLPYTRTVGHVSMDTGLVRGFMDFMDLITQSGKGIGDIMPVFGYLVIMCLVLMAAIRYLIAAMKEDVEDAGKKLVHLLAVNFLVLFWNPVYTTGGLGNQSYPWIGWIVFTCICLAGLGYLFLKEGIRYLILNLFHTGFLVILSLPLFMYRFIPAGSASWKWESASAGSFITYGGGVLLFHEPDFETFLLGAGLLVGILAFLVVNLVAYEQGFLQPQKSDVRFRMGVFAFDTIVLAALNGYCVYDTRAHILVYSLIALGLAMGLFLLTIRQRLKRK